jgi:hypothetical protein
MGFNSVPRIRGRKERFIRSEELLVLVGHNANYGGFLDANTSAEGVRSKSALAGSFFFLIYFIFFENAFFMSEIAR